MADAIITHFAFFGSILRAVEPGVYTAGTGDTAFAIRDEALFCDTVAGKRALFSAEQRFAKQGIRLIQIFGSEWRTRNQPLTELVLNALGAGSPVRHHARSLTVDMTADIREVNRFMAQWHPQGTGALNNKPVALRTAAGKIVAAMMFNHTADRRGAAAQSWTGASLTRYATSARVPGGASRLLTAWRRANPGVAVMSYSDPRLFSGGTYQQLGFTLVKRLAPDYLVWIPATDELRHKSACQRKRLEHWRGFLGRDDVPPYDHTTDPRTEFQMEDALGIKRVYQTGLLRWELAG